MPLYANDEASRELVVDALQQLVEKGLTSGTSGNVSVLTGDGMLVTPTGVAPAQLQPEHIVHMALDGEVDEGELSPSSEWSMHCAIFKARPDARAVVHAHAPHATILANAGLPFLPISTEAAFFGDIPRVPFIMPGTGELAEAVGQAMADSWACLMVNHGLIVAGRSLRRAADMIEIIDRSAEIILGCHAVGRPPPVLPDDVVETLRAMGDLVA